MTKLAHLAPDHRDFLLGLMTLPAKKPHEKIGVYFEWEPDTYAFVSDAFVYLEHNKKFKDSPPLGLWLTGATGVVRTQYGILCTYDDRYKHWKPAPIGWASPEDGPDLMNAMLRECKEELVVFSTDRKIQYVPEGVTAGLAAPSLGIPRIETSVEFGKFVPIRYNKKEGQILVLHCEWDLRHLPNNTTIAYDDDWWQGGYFGAPVAAMNEHGRITGYYSGQQGFVVFEECKPDEDLAVILKH